MNLTSLPMIGVRYFCALRQARLSQKPSTPRHPLHFPYSLLKRVLRRPRLLKVHHYRTNSRTKRLNPVSSFGGWY